MTLMLLSMLYFFSRVANYIELLSIHGGSQNDGGNMSYLLNRVKFENVQMLHIVTMVHSLTCIVISIFMWLMLQASGMIDRRQYYIMIFITTIATILYYFSIGYIIYVTGVKNQVKTAGDTNRLINVLDNFLDVISSLSNDVFSFLFALLMNFILLFGIYFLNMVSLYLADISKSIEHRRTGGRDKNELELNSFTVKK